MHLSGSSSSSSLSASFSRSHPSSPGVNLPISSPLPGHVLTLLPPLTIRNRLPLELHYYLKGTGVSGNLKGGKEAALHGVNMSENFDLGIYLENFRSCKELTIPPHTRHCEVMLRISDNKNRLLKLKVRISVVKGGAMKISILAPYWLVNKTGLPLIFRQDGSRTFAAGQFEEHERARSVTPLLFSFPEVEEQYLCQMRIGSALHGTLSRSQWSSRFSLEGGTSKKTLRVLNVESNRPVWVYTIGIQVTQGRGAYRGTNIVTFAPRFELDNLSRFKIAIAQQFMTKKDVTTVPQADYFTAFPESKLPFHWPRDDLDQLLCIKILDIQGCRWSGGFYIDKINSFHINMRDASENCHLLKVEVVQQGPTFFIVVADADVMPPPFRINNLSDMQVRFQQKGTVERFLTIIQPRTSIPYAWDEPTVNPLQLTLSIKGGTSASYSLDKLEEGEKLHYENFICLAATATFDSSWGGICPELVLDCIDGRTIVFKKQEKGKRNQLWRMTGSGMLEHEGSTSPRDPKRTHSGHLGLVLDMEDLAPRPGKLVPLILRKPDKLRKSTQTWKFTEQGLLCCEAGSMCIQAVGGTKGLFDGAKAVLGPGPDYNEAQETQAHMSLAFQQLQKQQLYQHQPLATALHHRVTSPAMEPISRHPTTGKTHLEGRGGKSDTSSSSTGPTPQPSAVKQETTPGTSAPGSGTPLHMMISRQKLHPGSGCISVRVVMDGPVRVLELVDIMERQVVKRMTTEKDIQEWEVYDELKGQLVDEKKKRESSANQYSLELSVALKKGVGVSVVNNQAEELLYVALKNISVEVMVTPGSISLDASVASIQADNQIMGATTPVVLYTPVVRRDLPDNMPALSISAHKVPSGEWKAEIFKHLFISTKRTTINLEEQLLWKLAQMAGVGKDDDLASECLDQAYDAHRALSAVTSTQGKRYYFGMVKLSVSQVTLSMITSNKLTPDLKAIKNALSVRLLAFEQANIDMHSFEQYHLFETGPFLLSEIRNHFTDELKGQAAKILGSVDFLGNPLGLFLDITEGITGFVKDGNVSGLLKNVTHGFSNTTAKVVSSLSDGISTVSLDEDHNQTREALRSTTSGSSSEHVMAGFKGLSHGLLGGVTSLVSQSIAGAQNEGFGGLIKGVGKGVLGTVTKPVSGVLDLTSGLANALRDSSTRTSQRGPKRERHSRCTQGPGGLLPIYSLPQADAQTRLHKLNNDDFSESLVAMEQLDYSSGEGNIYALISTRRVYFVNQRNASQDNILQIDHASILDCCSINADGKFFVELTRRTNVNDLSSLNKPRVRCEKQSISKKVAQEIKYAKNLFDERAQTLENDSSSDEGDN